MNCNRYKKMILLRDSGEISKSQLKKIDHHLEHCTDCRNFAASLNAIKSALPEMNQQPHPSISVNIKAAAEQWTGRRGGHWLPAGYLRAAAYAAILLLIAGPLFVVQNRRQQQIRIQNLNTIVSMLADPHDSAGNTDLPENEENLENFAGQLLKMEGFDSSSEISDEELFSLFGVPAPTTTRQHSNPVSPAKIYARLHQHSPTQPSRPLILRYCGSIESPLASADV